MKKMRKLWAVVILAVVLCCSLMVGCGKPTVNLNDYVKITCEGYDGYGSVSARIDYQQIIEDYADNLADNLDTSVFGDQTPSIAAAFVFESYKPFAIAYESPENAKNGDKVEFTWNTSESGIEQLAKVLDVEFKYENFTYEFEDLEPLKEVDPFEVLDLDYYGTSGQAKASNYGEVVIKTEDGQLRYDLEIEEDKLVSNGDTLKVSIDVDEYMEEDLAKNYGIILTRKEAEIIVEGAKYYPTENPQEVFEYLTSESVSLQNATKAVEDFYSEYTGEIKVEYVGALFCYADEMEYPAVASTADNNRLVLIFHIENGIEPGGWYNYFAPTNNVLIGYEKNEDLTLTKALKLDTGDDFSDGQTYYENCYYYRYNDYGYFEYDGNIYEGCQTIEEIVKIYKEKELVGENVFGKKIYSPCTNIIATEELEQYIK